MKIDDAKIILLHPGKTGGTSIEHTLRDKYLGKEKKLIAIKENQDIMFGFSKTFKLYLQHACLRLYSLLNIPFKEYKTITTVRRPYERILSCYFYNGKDKRFTFEEFVTTKLEQHYDINIINKHAKNHFSPQHYFTHHEDYIVDHIIRLENFQDDCLKIGLEVSYNYSKTKGTSRYKDYMDAYNQKTKDIVYNLYKEDFERYDYNK